MKPNKGVIFPLQVLVGSIVIIVGIIFLFIFTSSILGGLQETIATSYDENQCRTLITAKTIGGDFTEGLSDYILKLNKGCFKETVIIDSVDKQEVFEELGDRYASCWRRYGEGRVDFLNDFSTTGNWCFTCARVDFSSSENQVYEYSEFIDFLLEDEENKELFEAQFSDFKDNKAYNTLEEIESLQSQLRSLASLAEDSEAFIIYLGLEQDYVALTEVLEKRINTAERNYIVFRYDRPLDDKLETFVESYTKLDDVFWNQLGTLGRSNPFTATFNDDYVQYVDLMTQDQYFRSCGIEPSFERVEEET